MAIRLPKSLVFLVLLLVSRLPAGGSVVFNWPTSSIPWSAGTPGPGQTATEMFTSINPNDITLSINNNGTGPGGKGMIFNNQFPCLNAGQFTGGFSPTVNGVQLVVTKSDYLGAYVQETVTFATPVVNLSFQIWDVDAKTGQYIDKISNIQALTDTGATVGADSVTNVNPTYNTISGSGLGTVVLGIKTASDTTNQGTIDIVFNGPITQFSFQWSNNDPKLGQQGIALGPLTYTPVPETGTLVSITAACATVIGFEFFRRRPRRRNQERSDRDRLPTGR